MYGFRAVKRGDFEAKKFSLLLVDNPRESVGTMWKTLCPYGLWGKLPLLIHTPYGKLFGLFFQLYLAEMPL
jgi:hypothetical protein